MIPLSRRSLTRLAGFNLLELVVVLCALGVLFTFLISLMSIVRRNAAGMQCEGNMRRLSDALLKYAGDHNSSFPPNVCNPSPAVIWSDTARIGVYLNARVQSPYAASTVFVCPADSGASCSYSMNFWASSQIDPAYRSKVATALMWDAKTPQRAQMVLLAESWSYLGSPATSFRAAPTIGHMGVTAGQRFGGGGGITPFPAGRFGTVNYELAYGRHSDRLATNEGAQPHGNVTMAFGDGHVEQVSDGRMVDSTGRSTGAFRWTSCDLP